MQRVEDPEKLVELGTGTGVGWQRCFHDGQVFRLHSVDEPKEEARSHGIGPAVAPDGQVAEVEDGRDVTAIVDHAAPSVLARASDASGQTVEITEFGPAVKGINSTNRRERIVLGGRFGETGTKLGEDLLDRFLSAGGVAIDTAHDYAGGASERLIGRWLRSRRCRDEVVLCDKGCHPTLKGESRLSPEVMRHDLDESLQRLGTDRIDLYFLHRDDPSIPVDGMLSALERERERGRILAYGASNWTVPRLVLAAQAAANAHIEGFSAANSQFSLARPTAPIWPGTVYVDDEMLQWHAAAGIPLVAWSAQAQGWFCEATYSGLTAWDSPENRWKRRRAVQLGRHRGISPTAVALAYVLAPRCFPVIAAIGPQNVAELEDSLTGALELSPEELRFLEYGFQQDSISRREQARTT